MILAGLVLGVLDGGFPRTVWYPAALFLLALLVVIAAAAPPSSHDRDRLVEAALAAFALFCVWGFLSITWAATPGVAWDGANRILLYLVVIGTVALRPWSPRDATSALMLVAAGCTAIATGVLVTALTSEDPAQLFIQGRLADPTGYLNANASLWLIGVFPAAHIACSRRLGWPVRGLGLAAATLLLQMALLSQSRGAAIAFGVVIVVWVILTARRWSAVMALATTLGLTALAFDSLIAVHKAALPSQIGPALDDAAVAMGLSCAAALVAGSLAAVLGSRLESALAGRGIRRRGDVAVIVVGVLTAVAVLIAIGNPVDWADARWRDFKESGYSKVEAGENRFGGSLGSGRYDFYRVALNEFRAHPVRGVGADNFAVEYLRHRRTPEAPQYPHSAAFMVISQLGVVGAALLAVFLALMLTSAVRALRGSSGDERAVVAALMAAALVWLVHATGDWLWEFPALGTLGLGLLAVAARVRPVEPADPLTEQPLVSTPGEPSVSRRGPISSIGFRALLAVIALAAAISLSVPGVAARYVSAAYEDSRADPRAALARLERAAQLNRLSADPLVAKGVIAQRAGRRGEAVDAFRRAVDRAPDYWFAHLELGLALGLMGDLRDAESSLRTAARLNPRQSLTGEALAAVRRGEPLVPAIVERRLRAELERRFSPTDPSEAADERSGKP